MFTGLIQAIGTIDRIESSGVNRRLWIRHPREGFEKLVLGESIAVGGACLTVETIGDGAMGLFASSETLERTTLGARSAGGRVNLERALAFGDRLGGHLVSGHVDCVGRFLGAEKRDEAYWCNFEIPDPAWRPYLVFKGSIAVDGISLTVAALEGDRFSVAAIPVTWDCTTLADLRPGGGVNLEFDMVGKYILRWMESREPGAQPDSGGLDLEKLRQAGFE